MMKITLKRTSPNYRQKLSTHRIMNELTIAILILSIFAVAYNFTIGSDYGIHALMIFVISCVTALITEFVFAKVTKKEDPIKAIKNSFPLVTAIIFALTLPVGTPYYVVAIGSFIAIFFGKLIYGGFGMNIFNPALVGRVVVHLSFGAQLTTTLGGTDVSSTATPLTALASTNFLGEVETSLGQLFTGMYGGALGETCTILILVLGVFLAWRQVLDYRITVSYLLTAMVIAAVQGAIGGLNPLTNALTHLAMGGLAFGAVFMATDPVTSPTSPLGKVIYGIFLGFITMLIRFKANYPEGVLFSILIMNMFTPMIDNLTLGRTNQKMPRQIATVVIAFALAVVTVGGVSTTLELPEKAPEAPVEPEKTYELISKNGNTYVVSSQGFQGDIELEVTFDGDTVVSVSAVSYNGETEEYGKNLIETGEGGNLTPIAKAFHDAIFNASFTKADLEGIDTSTGATFTAKGIVEAIKGAMEEKENDPIVSADGNVYVVRQEGFTKQDKLQVEVTMDKANRQVVSVKVLSYTGETEGFGKDLIESGEGGNLAATSKAFYDKVLNGSFGYDEISGIDTSTGATFTSKGILSAVSTAIEAYDAVLEKSPDGIYTIQVEGFTKTSPMTVEVTVNGSTVESVKVLSYDGETAGFGKDLIENGEGGSLAPAAKSFHDTVLGGSFDAGAISGIDTSTGATFTTKGIVDAINRAVAADAQ